MKQERERIRNGYRRKAILDALDSALGGACVRLNTNGFSINVLGQKNAEGKTAGAFLLNLGCGRTMPLEFAIRNPASENYALHLPGKDPVPLTQVSRKKYVRADFIPDSEVRLVEAVALTEP